MIHSAERQKNVSVGGNDPKALQAMGVSSQWSLQQSSVRLCLFTDGLKRRNIISSLPPLYFVGSCCIEQRITLMYNNT